MSPLQKIRIMSTATIGLADDLIAGRDLRLAAVVLLRERERGNAGRQHLGGNGLDTLADQSLTASRKRNLPKVYRMQP
jgi:hypothetical protein